MAGDPINLRCFCGAVFDLDERFSLGSLDASDPNISAADVLASDAKVFETPGSDSFMCECPNCGHYSLYLYPSVDGAEPLLGPDTPPG